MKRKLLTYNRLLLQDIIDGLFIVVPLVVGVLWVFAALLTLVREGLWTHSPLVPIMWFQPHTLTVLSMSSFFFFTFYCLNYLFPHVRAVLSYAFVVLGLTFYDFVFALFEFLVTQHNKPTVMACPFLAALFIIVLYNRRYRFLTVSPLFFVFLGVFVSAMTLLSFSGFFETLHAGIDPHPNNWLWFVGKFTGVWTWSGIYQKRVKE